MKLKEISIGNYKCFSGDAQGFVAWGEVNLVIGRNNSGKSRLLDLVRYLCDPAQVKIVSPSFISVVGELEQSDIEGHFARNASGGDINGNHWDYGARFIGRVIRYKYIGNNVVSLDIDGGFDQGTRARYENLAKSIKSPLAGKQFVHVAAERSIRPEVASKNWIDPDGKGATAVIQRYLNDSSLPSELVEVDLLRELNLIFEPDNRFTRILVQQHGNGKWEVYLEEERKGRIPLSVSGSGLQTVLLILLGIHTAPTGEGRPKSELVIAIEEPENNLHPALQRRLLSSLQKFAKNHGAKFFITTHSTVAIDQFVGQKGARLFHVRHDGEFAKVSSVEAYSDGHEILRDLDVRASDLLQSNGIIWVEGPTDRLYINKWIELATNGQLREGAHYQCVFYGGKLLSHLSADGDLSLKKELIDLITVNKNAAIVIDSDRRNEKGRLNATKSRIKSEFEGIGAFVWITKGREIENYIHKDQLVDIFGSSISAVDKLSSVMEWVLDDSKRKKVAPDKITLASKVVDRALNDTCLDVLDLRAQIIMIISKIKSWNNL